MEAFWILTGVLKTSPIARIRGRFTGQLRLLDRLATGHLPLRLQPHRRVVEGFAQCLSQTIIAAWKLLLDPIEEGLVLISRTLGRRGRVLVD